MEQNTFDALVIGAGAMGSMTAWQLAKRGFRTAAVEQFQLGHNRGSSHGQTRIIRQAYFEHPDYVPLLKSSYELWDELEQASGEHLFQRCGLFVAGDPESSVILKGIDQSVARFRLDVENLSHGTAKNRFPQFQLPPTWEARFEPNAGYLLVESAIRTAAAAAREAGCEVLESAKIAKWDFDGKLYSVWANGRRLQAPKLIICSGAWTSQVLPNENLPLVPRRVVVHWYQEELDAYSERSGTPCFGFDTDAGFLYGFPSETSRDLKAGLHVPGDILDDPNVIRRHVDPSEHLPVSERLVQYLPKLKQPPHHSETCIYTMSPDEHFIVDESSQYPGLFYACGFSGHGFKFAPMVGLALADLATDGETALPIKFLKKGRFESCSQ